MKNLFIIIVVFLLPLCSSAQVLETIEQLQQNTRTALAKQTFTPTVSGYITKIAVVPAIGFNPSGVIEIREGVFGDLIGTSQNVNLIMNVLNEIALDNPIKVNAGQLYTLIPPTAIYNSSSINPYPGGQAYSDLINLPQPCCDMVFVIEISAAPVPTLSQWGLIILSLCFSIVGFVAVRQRLFSPV